MPLDTTLRHFLYKTSPNALIRNYFVNNLVEYSHVEMFCLKRVTRILKVRLRKRVWCIIIPFFPANRFSFAI